MDGLDDISVALSLASIGQQADRFEPLGRRDVAGMRGEKKSRKAAMPHRYVLTL